MIEFKPYGKTPRLFRDIVVTEKIDGTNAGIQIERHERGDAFHYAPEGLTEVVPDTEHEYWVIAQSRNKIITPGKSSDNAGFATWVQNNAHALVETLGEGVHFGEWYGEGIQSNPYKISGKRFALFNVHRWGNVEFAAAGLPDVEAVPTLYIGPNDLYRINKIVDHLRFFGSRIRQGAKAEGIVVYHTQSKQVYKVLCVRDDLPKTVRDAA